MALALIAGAGVVGLAAGRALALAGHEVVIAEAAAAVGTGISARNSEVIHAGLYYPTGSLRHRHCVGGRRLLYAYARDHGIAHARPGKLVVATTAAETGRIEAIHALGLANGVETLRLLSAAEARALEPALACTAALHSPETGIIDAHGLMLALLGEIEDHGGAIALDTPVLRLEYRERRWQVGFGGADAGTIEADLVVNAAGLGAQALARNIAGLDPALVPPLVLAKGNYFSYQGRPAFRHLIYPAPVDGGLGVHVTLDLAGRMRFGPDVEWPAAEDYTVDPARMAGFEAGIRRYWPGLPAGRLAPDYAGIRPKLTGPGAAPADFLVQGPADHGLPGLVNLFGIESPGLTACLSLGAAVAEALKG
ncbi:NAD(P)/FAD-dependent oxidoreductase [Zavarzinia compransoris]|uniref:FAD-dependent oxidoreductase n=1 Tax=Zavarzinia compransoris TaxID=1264899 RepID=A0A317DWD8_9PROT|nr:NAD(P)/FAD-dependent oxidoreductase [Zavarzinia compransoris]PWR19028.1 FAD-dependent oxidoreductase [Zavarzinia compransoris]TDP49035.1 L-2-hydroxyglutarate oxidase LhgO [Zavarzinia compransoris]